MFTKMKLALAAALIVSAASPVFAEGADYNPRDRHPGPVAQTQGVSQQPDFRYAAAALNGRSSSWERQWMARASQSSGL